jgi:putative ABC transport system substrate-binding protein
MQFDQLKRRQFITLIGGAAAWPGAARAQQAIPTAGWLGSGSPEPYAPFVKGFQHGLREVNYVERQNVMVEYRWARGQYDQLPALAADLISRKVALIVAAASPAARAAKAATATIPIVFSVNADPVSLRLVESLNRPGGNATGMSHLGSDLTPKQLELLHELIPRASIFAQLVNPNNPNSQAQITQAQEAAHALGLQIEVVTAGSESEIDTVFTKLGERRPGALLIGGDAFFLSRRGQLAALAIRHSIPTMFDQREFAAGGGLMTYGTNLVDTYRQVGVYAGRILKGERPADLPVQQPTKFELVINVKTAKRIGLTIPEAFLLRANEVVE